MAHELGDDPSRRRVTTTERNDDDREEPDVDAETEIPPDGGRDRAGGGVMRRREYLKAGVVAAATGVVASGGASAEPEREGIRFERVIDAVDDLAADPTGSVPVNGSLAGLPRNSLVRFPEGDYLMDGRIEIDGHDVLGFETTDDATIVGGRVDSGIDLEGVDSAYYGGFSHDRSDGTVRHQWDVSEHLRHRNVVYGPHRNAKAMRGTAGGKTTNRSDTTSNIDTDGSGGLLEIVADGTSTTYDVTVSDDVRAVEAGATSGESDVSGSCAEGSITDGVHAFRYDGAITAIDVGTDADVYLNGNELDVGSKPLDPTFENVVIVDTNGLDASARYRFAADGDAAIEEERTTRGGGGWEALSERIDGGDVSGRVDGDADAYRFAEGLSSLTVEGSARVSVGNAR